jgi:hypothetical protein
MPTQRADDAGRQIRQPWLGAVGARWPMDWTYGEWGLAAAALTIGGTLITWVIPSGLVMFLFTRWVAEWITARAGQDNPKRTYWLVVGCIVALCVLLSINPLTWLGPIWWPLALITSAFLPFKAVKRWGKYVTWNRPIGYWLRLVGQAARGPRKHKPVRARLILPDLEELSHDTDEIKPGRIVTIPRPRLTKPKAKPVVKAKISNAPKRPVKVSKREQRLVPEGRPPRERRRYIERTPTGLKIFGTEYRLEDHR